MTKLDVHFRIGIGNARIHINIADYNAPSDEDFIEISLVSNNAHDAFILSYAITHHAVVVIPAHLTHKINYKGPTAIQTAINFLLDRNNFPSICSENNDKSILPLSLLTYQLNVGNHKLISNQNIHQIVRPQIIHVIKMIMHHKFEINGFAKHLGKKYRYKSVTNGIYNIFDKLIKQKTSNLITRDAFLQFYKEAAEILAPRTPTSSSTSLFKRGERKPSTEKLYADILTALENTGLIEVPAAKMYEAVASITKLPDVLSNIVMSYAK